MFIKHVPGAVSQAKNVRINDINVISKFDPMAERIMKQAAPSQPFLFIEKIDFSFEIGGKTLDARIYRPANKNNCPLVLFDAGLRAGIIGDDKELPAVGICLALLGNAVLGTKSRQEVGFTEVADYICAMDVARNNFSFSNATVPVGVSSGSALALGVAANSDAVSKHGIKGVIGMGGYANLAWEYDYAKQYISSENTKQDPYALKILAKYISYANELGVSPASNPELFKDSSPEFFAGRINVPIFLISGEKDQVNPASEMEKLYNQLLSSGKDIQFKATRGWGIHTPFDSMTAWNVLVKSAVRDNFLGLVDSVIHVTNFIKEKIG